MTQGLRASSPFAALPAALIATIASHATSSDIARLLRVNSLFHKACVKVLYTQVADIVFADTPPDGDPRRRRPCYVHLRPPLDNVTYAQHVRCLDVRAHPEACCDHPPFTLPNLEVLRLRFDGNCNNGDTVPLLVLADDYKPKTLVISLATFRKDSLPMAYLATKIQLAHLVLVVKHHFLCDMAVSKCTPRNAHSVTIIIQVDTVDGTLYALLMLCLRFANLDCCPFEYHRLQHVRFVLGGVDFSPSCYNQLLLSLQDHIKKYTFYKGRKMPFGKGIKPVFPPGPSSGDNADNVQRRVKLPPPAIELCSLDEYLSQPQSQLVLSEKDIMQHLHLYNQNRFNNPKLIKNYFEDYRHVGMIMRTDMTPFGDPDDDAGSGSEDDPQDDAGLSVPMANMAVGHYFDGTREGAFT